MDHESNMLAVLEEECAEAQKKLEKWTDMCKETLNIQKENHNEAVLLGKEQLKALGQKEKAFIEQVDAVKKKGEAERQVLQEATNNVYNLKEQQQRIPAEVEELRDEVFKKRQEVEAEMQQYDAALQEKRYKTDELTKGVDYYKRFLGLEFRRVEENRLRFVMRYIDPNNHNRKFVFAIFVNDENKYAVTECTPEVSNISELVDKLNESNDFSAFVRRVRKEFQKLV